MLDFYFKKERRMYMRGKFSLHIFHIFTFIIVISAVLARQWLHPWGPLAVSRDNFGCRTWGTLQSPVVGGQGCCQTHCDSRHSPRPRRVTGQNVNCARKPRVPRLLPSIRQFKDLITRTRFKGENMPRFSFIHLTGNYRTHKFTSSNNSNQS